MTLARWLLSASGVAGVGLAVWWHGQLPERVAMHFGPGGVADDYAGRSESLAVWIGLHIIMTVIGLAAAGLLSRVPTGWVNVPRRDYWLNPERRAETIRRLGDTFCILQAAINLFFIHCDWLLYRANLQEPPRLDETPLFVGVATLLLFDGAWVTGLIVRFYRVPPTAADGMTSDAAP